MFTDTSRGPIRHFPVLTEAGTVLCPVKLLVLDGRVAYIRGGAKHALPVPVINADGFYVHVMPGGKEVAGVYHDP